ncbi:MAG: PadR family transcriptional regulator [Actinomycetota bacterium]
MLKYLLLALLAERPRHGYELKRAFEELLGGTWVLNIGQIYVTLGRLEEDGLISAEVVQQELLPDRKVWTLTEIGAKELARWTDEPAGEAVKVREELYFKVLAQALAGGDIEGHIWHQRESLVRALSELGRLHREAGGATALLIEGAILRVEADMKWLDICEARVKELKA